MNNLLRFPLLLLLSAIVLLPQQCLAEDVLMIFDKHYIPFYMEGLEQGAYIDFLKEFEKEYPEFTIKKISLPRKRLDLYMETGKADVFSLNSPLFMDASNYTFTDPIWLTGDHVVSKKSRPVIYHRPKDLFNVTVGIIMGNGYGILNEPIASKKIKTHRVVDYNRLFKLLIDDRVDCIIANRHMVLYGFPKAGLEASQIEISTTPVYEFELMPVTQKQSTEFLTKMNAFIRESKRNGLLHQINSKYFSK